MASDEETRAETRDALKVSGRAIRAGLDEMRAAPAVPPAPETPLAPCSGCATPRGHMPGCASYAPVPPASETREREIGAAIDSLAERCREFGWAQYANARRGDSPAAAREVNDALARCRSADARLRDLIRAALSAAPASGDPDAVSRVLGEIEEWARTHAGPGDHMAALYDLGAKLMRAHYDALRLRASGTIGPADAPVLTEDMARLRAEDARSAPRSRFRPWVEVRGELLSRAETGWDPKDTGKGE